MSHVQRGNLGGTSARATGSVLWRRLPHWNRNRAASSSRELVAAVLASAFKHGERGLVVSFSQVTIEWKLLMSFEKFFLSEGLHFASFGAETHETGRMRTANIIIIGAVLSTSLVPPKSEAVPIAPIVGGLLKFAQGYLAGKGIDFFWDKVTNKPNIRKVNERLEYVERHIRQFEVPSLDKVMKILRDYVSRNPNLTFAEFQREANQALRDLEEQVRVNARAIEQNSEQIELNLLRIDGNAELIQQIIQQAGEDRDQIRKNTNRIEKNTNGIEKNTNGIEKNTNGIEENTNEIEKNTNEIEKLKLQMGKILGVHLDSALGTAQTLLGHIQALHVVSERLEDAKNGLPEAVKQKEAWLARQRQLELIMGNSIETYFNAIAELRENPFEEDDNITDRLRNPRPGQEVANQMVIAHLQTTEDLDYKMILETLQGKIGRT